MKTTLMVLCLLILIINNVCARTHPRLSVDLSDVEIDTTLDMGAYGVNTSSDISGVNEIKWADGTVQVSSPVASTDTRNAPLYCVVIATYTGEGIDYVCDGTDDDVQFHAAINNHGENTQVYTKAGNYYFNNPATFTVRGVTLKGSKPVFYHTAGNFTTKDTFFYITTDTIKLKDLEFDGTGFTDSYRWVRSDSTEWAIARCIFKNKSYRSNSAIIVPEVGGNWGIVRNCRFSDIASTYVILNYADHNIFSTNAYYDGYGYCEIRGNHNLFTNSTVDGSWRGMYLGNGSYITIANNLFTSLTDHGFVSYADNVTLVGNVFYNCTGNGTHFASGSDNILCSNNMISTCGGTGNNHYGVYVGCDNSTITGNSFYGNMDSAAVYVASGVQDVNINGNDFNGITGNEYVIQFGGSYSRIQAKNNVPVENNFDILVASQTIGGYPDIGVPSYKNTEVTTIGYVVWKSTGTTNDTDWIKISQ